MNKHLKLVRAFNDTLSLSQAEYGANGHLSDMDIVMRQALLMEEGSAVLKAIKAGDMVELLAGLVRLAYYALGAIAIRGDDVVERPVTWQHDGSVVSLMCTLTEKINSCTSGSTEDYSAVYCLCIHLTRSFINADFDQAFQMLHDGNLSAWTNSADAGEVQKLTLSKSTDLSECLYE